MSIEIIGLIALVALVALVGLFLVWRTVKTFVKLALVGFIALIIIGALVWWNFSGGRSPATNGKRPANTGRQANR